MNRKETLKQLCEALRDLVGLLRLDKRCRWTDKFERDLDQASQLLKNGFSDQDIENLSTSIRYVYQGSGSFNDYGPGTYNPKTGRYDATHDTENFEAVSQRVYDLALKLLSGQ